MPNASGGISLTWTGLEKLESKLEAVAIAAPIELGGALYRFANELLLKVLRITPIQFGNLRASGHVTLPVVTASGA